MLVGMAAEQELVPCSNCGSLLTSIDVSQPTAVCTSCGAVVQIPEAVRQRLLKYQQQVAEELLQRESALRGERAIERQTSDLRRGFTVRGIVLFFVGIWASCLLLYLVPKAFGVDDQLAGTFAYVGAIAYVPLVFGLKFIFGTSKAKKVPLESAPKASAMCQACGAPIAFEPGAVSTLCAFCGSANAAPQSASQEVIHWAERQANSAQAVRDNTSRAYDELLESRTQEYKHAASVASWIMPLMWPMFFVVMGVMLATMGDPKEQRSALVIAGLGLAAIVGILVFKLIRLSR